MINNLKVKSFFPKNLFEEKVSAQFIKKSLIILTIIFFIQIFLVIILHNNFHTIFEVGIVEQSLWNTINGDFFRSVSNTGNHFANHNEPILFLMLPIYYLIEHTYIIFFLNNLIILLGVIPIYLISKKYLNSRLTLAFSISYLLFPSFIYTNTRSFHAIMMSATFIGFTIYFILKNDFSKTLIYAFLALTTNETIALLLIFIGFFCLIKKNIKTAIWLIIISIFWFHISTQLIIPHFHNDAYRFYDLYDHLGTNIGEISKTLILNPKQAFSTDSPKMQLKYLSQILSHNLFLSIISPETLLIITPVILQNIFSSSSYKYNLLAHYTYPIIPIIIISSIIGLSRINKKFKINDLLLVILIISGSIFSFTIGIKEFVTDNCLAFKNDCQLTGDIIGNSPRENYEEIHFLLNKIPSNSSVAAQNHIFNHISNRRNSYLFERTDITQSDYIILDNSHTHNDIIDEEGNIINKNYLLIDKQKDIYLLKKTDD